MRAKYSLVTTASVALAAATAKTVLGARAGAAFGFDLYEWGVAFDGVTAANTPVLVELVSWSATSTGTSTAATPIQVGGRTIAHGSGTTGQNFTVEPTTLTVIKSILLTPNGGTFVETLDPMNGLDSDVAQGFGIRCTAAQIVNVRAYMEWFRI